MSAVMEEEIKRWTARRKSVLVLEILQGKTTVSEASRQFDLPPGESPVLTTVTRRSASHGSDTGRNPD